MPHDLENVTFSDALENVTISDPCYSAAFTSGATVTNRSIFDGLTAVGCNCTSIAGANNVFLQCTESEYNHAWWVQAIFITMFGVMVTLAVAGNVTVAWIVLAHRRMRTVTNYFLLNLAIADTSISMFNTCFSFTQNLYYHWVFGDQYCKFSNLMGVTPTVASVSTLMCMSVDRWWAIVNPFRKRLRRKTAICIIAAIWMFAFLCGCPQLLTSYTVNIYYYTEASLTVQTLCHSDKYPDGYLSESVLFKAYNYFLLVANYLLPLVLLTGTYTWVGCVLWGEGAIGDHRHEESTRAKRKVVKMMVTVVVIFMVCWLPYHLYFTFLVDYIATLGLNGLYIFLNIYWLAMSTTMYNPIIYCRINSRFRIGFRYAFRWLPGVHMTTEEYARSELCSLHPSRSDGCSTVNRSTHTTRLSTDSALRRGSSSRSRILSTGSVMTPVMASAKRKAALAAKVTFEDKPRKKRVPPDASSTGRIGHANGCLNGTRNDSPSMRLQSATPLIQDSFHDSDVYL